MNSNPVLRHIESSIGKITVHFQEIISDDLTIDLIHVGSTLFRGFEVVVTSGMSAMPMNIPPGVQAPAFAEVLTILPKGWPMTKDALMDERNYWPLRLLKDIARYTHHEQTWIGYGHTVAMAASPESTDQPQPYAPGIEFCAALIMPSLSLGQKAWSMKTADGKEVFFWCAVPLHKKELQFKMEHGVDPLLDLMDKHKVNDRINPKRLSIV